MTVTAQQLADETGADVARATRVLPVAVARVERYAPAAPEDVRDEAVMRFGGYLLGSDFGGVRSESIGPREVEYVTNHGPAFRHSGAAGLLSPWKVRRA